MQTLYSLKSLFFLFDGFFEFLKLFFHLPVAGRKIINKIFPLLVLIDRFLIGIFEFLHRGIDLWLKEYPNVSLWIIKNRHNLVVGHIYFELFLECNQHTLYPFYLFLFKYRHTTIFSSLKPGWHCCKSSCCIDIGPIIANYNIQICGVELYNSNRSWLITTKTGTTLQRKRANNCKPKENKNKRNFFHKYWFFCLATLFTVFATPFFVLVKII